jgi:hypothetical protein
MRGCNLMTQQCIPHFNVIRDQQAANHQSVSEPPPVTAVHMAQPLLQTTLLTDHQGFMVSIKTTIVEPTMAIKAQQRLVSKSKRVDIKQWWHHLGVL